jgi:hypothetical protein
VVWCGVLWCGLLCENEEAWKLKMEAQQRCHRPDAARTRSGVTHSYTYTNTHPRTDTHTHIHTTRHNLFAVLSLVLPLCYH